LSVLLLLLYILKYAVKNKEIFKDLSQNDNKAPPIWIRFILLSTCTMVSFSHGNNDGQKGVGVLMIVLLAMLPGHYALNPEIKLDKLEHAVAKMNTCVNECLKNETTDPYCQSLGSLEDLEKDIKQLRTGDDNHRLATRQHIKTFSKIAKVYLEDPDFIPDANSRKEFKAGLSLLNHSTDFAPIEAILLISLSLGFGTMIGWKRIVVTIGEKIGKSHLTYAQGATAELVAAGTIGLSTGLGLPVSTTHVLSSGIAGSMVGMGGIKNLQRSTITTIAMAWVLTLPVTFIGALAFYYLFQWIL